LLAILELWRRNREEGRATKAIYVGTLKRPKLTYDLQTKTMKDQPMTDDELK